MFKESRLIRLSLLLPTSEISSVLQKHRKWENMCTLATHGQETETKPTEASRPMDGMGTRRDTAEAEL